MRGLPGHASTPEAATVMLTCTNLTSALDLPGSIGRRPRCSTARRPASEINATAMGALVSVILPTFNRAHCVGQAIDSALQQTHRDLEVIVVDDGSVDQTCQFMKRKYGEFRSIRYIYQENKGVAAARNTALRAAQGEFIAFLDSDDVWKPWKIELQLACMEKLPHIGMVWSDM